MSTLSNHEQSQLDSTMEREIVSHQTAIQAAIEGDRCPRCRYHLKTELTDRLITFRCADPAGTCGWSAMYPIAVAGNSSKEYSRGYVDGFTAGQSNALAATNAMVEM